MLISFFCERWDWSVLEIEIFDRYRSKARTQFSFHLSKKGIDLIQKILLFLVIFERIRSHSSPSNRPRVIIGSINLDTDFGTSSFQFPPSRILLLTSVAENFGLS